MAKHRGAKPKHPPGYVSHKSAKVSAAQVRAKEAKTKEINGGKRKKVEEATAKLMQRKADKAARQFARDYPGRRY